MRCFRARIAVFMLAWIPVAAFGQGADMKQADSAFTRAVANSDKSELAKLLDADFTWTNSSGKIQTRAQVLSKVPQPAITNANDAETKGLQVW